MYSTWGVVHSDLEPGTRPDPDPDPDPDQANWQLPYFKATCPPVGPSFEIRVLGELEVVRGGNALPLPASKKTRALLGYLVVAGGRAQSRQRLCELLWDGPDDPRAALRWSLTKLRQILDDSDGARLSADREHVGFEQQKASVDLAWIGQNVGDAARAPIERLRRAASLFRGELLEGLELPECYRFHEWCVAEREQARRRHGEILTALANRVDEPEEALTHARRRVAIDPLAEPGHIVVMQLLAKLGRPREAVKQYESCRRILEGQLGRSPSKELEAARSLLGRVSVSPLAAPIAPQAVPVARAANRSETRAALVGREAEQAVIAEALREAAVGGSSGRVLLLLGEPGIGKTRLLAEAAERAAGSGGAALFGRAFEAEMVRPYGAWIDVLRSAPLGALDGPLRADLAPLLPELGAGPIEIDRNRLFQGVVRLLVDRAAHGPLVVALDDVQWFDEASAALLHYAARNVAGSRVVLACAARAAEIGGNPRVQAMVRALAREGRLTRVELSPLDAAATAELVQSVGDVDPSRIFADAGGNPLFSLELARALAQSDGGATAPTLDGLITDRLSRIDERGADLLPWAAALGGGFAIDTLAKVTGLPAHDLFAAVAELERHGVLRVVASASPAAGYDFAHDLVRRSAYRAMSEPRRRWVHLQIARALSAAGDPGGARAGEIAHHAALGGDSALASRAYLAAGQRCLRMFAQADASQLAASGIQHIDHLPPECAVPLRVELLSVQVLSNRWLGRPSELEAQLARATVAARDLGMPALVARCHFLLSFVHSERGDLVRASASTLQAEQAGRAADIETRQRQVANTGRCLAMIEHDMAHAQDLLNEAQALGDRATGRTLLELVFGMGVLHAFKGEHEQAQPLLERAAELSALESDHWVQSQALTRLARIALERDRPEETRSRCLALRPLVAKLPEGSEEPLVATLEAIARLKLGDSGARAAVDDALARLRAVDSKAYLAYALDVVAEHDARAGQGERAREGALEALAAADSVGQRSEAAVARSLLARLALERGDRGEASAQLAACGLDEKAPLALSARARGAVSRVAALLDPQLG